MFGRSFEIRVAIILAFVLLASLVSLVPSTIHAQTTDNHYTSPTYGYSVEIPATWFVLEEGIEQGYDYLLLSDFERFVYIAGGPSTASPAAELSATMLTCGSNGTSNCLPVTDAQDNPIRYVDDNRAYAIIAYDIEDDSGFETSLVSYMEIIALGNGMSIAISAEMTPETFADGLLPIGELIAGIQTPGGVSIEPIGPTAGNDPAVVPAPIPGVQPLPAYAVDGWRISIVAAAKGEAIPALNLEPKDGREWVAIVADVTNLTPFSSSFSLREPLLQTPEMDEPWDIAPSSTRQAARLLAESVQGNEDIEIGAGNTERIVLVYSIPAAGSRVDMVHGETAIVIDNHFVTEFVLTDLPVSEELPTLETAVINGVSVDTFGQLSIGLDDRDGELVLVGISMPTFGSCNFAESLNDVTDFVGSTVELEFDDAAGNVDGVYLWLVNEDGSKTLLNQLLLAQGVARYAELPTTARFATWLETSELIADETDTGLWEACLV